MTDAVEAVLAAVEGGRVDEVRLLLHPYLRWTTPDGRVLRGRMNVLAHLREGYDTTPHRAAGVAVELRDGQIYRWT